MQAVPMALILLLILPYLSYASPETYRVVVIVSDSPVLKKAKALGLDISEASDMFKAPLMDEVERRLDSLRSSGVQLKVVDVLTYVLHGAVIEISQPLELLESVAPDLKVYQDVSLQISLEKSSKLVRAEEAHSFNTSSGEPLTGRGVVVAVLDTGIDYTHPDLGGTIGPGQKILKGYDFVDEDEDPIDRDGHGTEVTGIIAADGRIKGIAPEASLLAYRVVDKMGNVKSSDLIRALERASLDGADIINLSLGTKEEIESLSYAIENIVGSGVVVVAATGNSAERAFGEPAGRRGVIAVGASLNNVSSPRDAEVIINPDGFELIAVFMNGSRPVPTGVTGSLVYVNFAREKDVASLDLRGKIALAERGGEPGELIYFSAKEANVAARGALGLIVHNYEGGLFLGNLIGPHNPPNYEPSIPVVSISNRDGVYLREELSKGAELGATILTNRSAQIGVDRVAMFSSRGPVSSFYIKPDIVAPGVSVNTTATRGEYSVVDGTSFAAPHVTGAAALLLQAHPELTPEEVAGILAPTSKVLTDQWKSVIPSFTQGSGRLDVLSAVTSPLALEPYQLIFHLAAGQPNHTRILKLVPMNSETISVSVDISWNFSSNIPLIADSDTEYIRGDTPSELSITASLLDADPGHYEGRITLRPSGGYPNLTLPVLVYVNDASLELAKVEDTYKVSVQSDERFTAATVHVISPNGIVQTHNLRYGDSIPVNILYSGEYWIEAEVDKPSGVVFARGVYHILEPVSRYVGVPQRFLQIFGSFMVLAVAVGLIMIAVNRTNRRDLVDPQL
jgi:minor extracellular serine protease Vpr